MHLLEKTPVQPHTAELDCHVQAKFLVIFADYLLVSDGQVPISDHLLVGECLM